MPNILPQLQSIPERAKRHIALRELATAQAAGKGQTGHRDAEAWIAWKANRGGTPASHWK